MKPTAKDAILRHLMDARRPLAIHEIDIPGISQNSAAARLRELTQEGQLVRQFRPGKSFKEWMIPQVAPTLPGMSL